jgi:D-glycero-alpha-D-manno-heptose-7-phosphate kinase
MGLPTGQQDHYPALLGGVLSIAYRPGGDRVRRLEVDLEALGDTLIVAYTGQSHFSAGNNWQIIRRRLERDGESVACFDGIAEMAHRLESALEAGDFERAGALIGREWDFRKRLAEAVSTPRIEMLLNLAGEAGAWGGKACGAGGGGCISLLVPPESRAEVIARLEAEGALILPARPVAGALEVRPGGHL